MTALFNGKKKENMKEAYNKYKKDGTCWLCRRKWPSRERLVKEFLAECTKEDKDIYNNINPKGRIENTFCDVCMRSRHRDYINKNLYKKK